MAIFLQGRAASGRAEQDGARVGQALPGGGEGIGAGAHVAADVGQFQRAGFGELLDLPEIRLASPCSFSIATVASFSATSAFSPMLTMLLRRGWRPADAGTGKAEFVGGIADTLHDGVEALLVAARWPDSSLRLASVWLMARWFSSDSRVFMRSTTCAPFSANLDTAVATLSMSNCPRR